MFEFHNRLLPKTHHFMKHTHEYDSPKYQELHDNHELLKLDHKKSQQTLNTLKEHHAILKFDHKKIT